MTSIFDQHEQALQVSQRTNPPEPMTSSGYINMQLEDNKPMFSKQKMNLTPSDSITHIAVASDYLVLAMANGRLFRLNLQMPDSSEEIQYTKYVQQNTKLSGIFLDPLGYHLLLAFAARNKEGSPELAYLHRKSFKLKSVTKSRNFEVTEVGWNNENTSESSTGPILLGTSQGHIIETELETDSDKSFTASQQYWRQIFDIGRGTETPITGLQFHRVGNTTKYFIFVTTPTRLYQFIGHAVTTDGKPSLQTIFHQYLTTPETSFQEIPSSLKYSKLQFFVDRYNTPKMFAWLTEPGIFYGQLDPSSQQNSNSLFTQGELINYPSDSEDLKEKTPLAFVLTEFHALIMYSDRVKAISLLNQELVYQDHYSEVHGKLKNLVKDPVKKTIWAVTEKTVFRYKVVREERNVWRIYCDKEEFDLAKEYCHNNPAFIDIINVKQAELLFEKGDYERSAEIFAETQSSFETICLKFLQIDKINALKVYLGKRLDALKDDDKTLISMIVIWMTELYLSQLGLLRRTGKEDSQEYHHIQSDFEVFLLQPKVVKCMQHVKSVIYDLMSSHGDKQNLIKLTIINEDYENVVSQHIYKQSYLEALNLLQTLKRPELFYQFAPILIEKSPKHTVNALISQGTRLSPSKLLPAFLSCENDEVHISEIIRYLEFMMQNFNVKDKAIHNYLLTLYVEHDQASLKRYMARQGQDVTMVNYDVHYALRLCREKDLPEACVKLSALLGLWSAAVELSLAHSDLSLAKSVASQPDSMELQRQLWLNIAEHVITKNQDLKEAMSFLEECPLVKIEDILPFFSDVVTIDHFREPICQSLQEYNNQIEELKTEMEEATHSAECVRSEIQSFRSRSVLVSVTDSCCLCDIALLLRPFYLFPCGHKFHSDCLLSETQPILGEPPTHTSVSIVSVTDSCCLCDIALLLRPFYLFPCGHKFHSDCLLSETQPILGEPPTHTSVSIVSVTDSCCLCDIALLLRPFYLFPCGHKFHSDCLLSETQPILGEPPTHTSVSIVSVTDSCCLCDIALLLRPFYLFPCGHKFHSDCLLSETQPILGEPPTHTSVSIVSVTDSCCLCDIALLLRPFYLFPCGHKFHSDCLLSETQPILGEPPTHTSVSIVSVTDSCCLCDIALLLRPFYLFPCGHKFHSDCLLSETQPILGEPPTHTSVSIVSVTDSCCLCDIALLLRPFYLFPCGHKFHSDCLLSETQPILGEPPTHTSVSIVSVTDSCCLCDIALLLRPFYLFPCGHKFHSDCLLSETQPILAPARRSKLTDLQRQLTVLSSIELNTVTSSGLPLKEDLKSEVDEIVASECIFCGEHMISCIDKPFIPPEDWDRVLKEWE